MYIKSLTLRGFKTFADRTEILLDPVGGITAIVGPNGCGKSNIVDAIRWVLGEQSSKTLRTEALEEVIFAGSVDRKPLSMAEITLLMENSDGLLPIEFEEVAVKRRVFRDCESEFFINKSPCRLKDIKDLFLDTGLGGGTYSIISQGQVDAILSSKPEDRRAIFEEAAGINKYKTRKHAAERKLIAAEQNLLRVSDLRGEIGGQLDVLNDQAQKAEEYMQAKNRLKEVEIGLCKKQLAKFFEKRQELTTKIESIKQEAEKSQDVLRQNEEKKAVLRNQIRALEAEERQLRTRMMGEGDQELKNQILVINASLADKRNAIRDLEEKIRFSSYEIERNQKAKTQFEERTRVLNCEIPGLTTMIGDIKGKLEQIKTSVSGLSVHKQSFEEEEVTILESILGLVKDIYAKVSNIYSDLASKLTLEQQTPAERISAILNMGKSLGGLLQELEEGTHSLEGFLNRKKDFKTATTTEETKETDLKIELAKHEAKLSNMQDEATRIQAELSIVDKTNGIQSAEIAKHEEEKIKIVTEVSAIEEKLSALEQKLEQERTQSNLQLEELAKKREALENEHDQLDAHAHTDASGQSIGDSLMKTEIALAKLEGENKAIEDKLMEEYSMTVDEAAQTTFDVPSVAKAKEEINGLRHRLRELEPVNLLAIDEYKRVKDRMNFIDEQYADLMTARDNLQNLINELDLKAQKSFLETLDVVNRNFQEIFASLFEGGDAKIVLGEGADVLSAGIEIVARPRGKKWLSLSLLSGGEKSLTAIAILFSLLKTHPSPFCFLDEVDAALDDANVKRFSRMLKEFAKTIQMVVITHNKRTMESADVIYGITMEEMGISKIISMKLSAVAA